MENKIPEEIITPVFKIVITYDLTGTIAYKKIFDGVESYDRFGKAKIKQMIKDHGGFINIASYRYLGDRWRLIYSYSCTKQVRYD